MKKWMIALSATVLLLPATVSAETEKAPEIDARSAILYNVSTDEVLFEKDMDEPRMMGNSASVMTLLLASEALKKGDIKRDDTVTISEKAWRAGNVGNRMFLEVNQTAKVDELMKGLALVTGNDAATSLAEHIAGSTDAFVKEMNKRAAELGMKNTHFETVNGTSPDDTSTAKDLLILTKTYWSSFSGNMKAYHTQSDMLYDTRPGKPVRVVQDNEMMNAYTGTVGLKTGTVNGRSHAVTTVNRGGMKMIVIVLEANGRSKRTQDAVRLLQYGANQYKVVQRSKKGSDYGKFPVYKSTQVDKSPVAFQDDVHFVVRTDVDPDTLRYEYEGKSYLVGGTKKGEIVGKQKVYHEGRLLNETNIVATETLKKGKGLSLFFDSIAIFFSHTLVDFLSSLVNRGD